MSLRIKRAIEATRKTKSQYFIWYFNRKVIVEVGLLTRCFHANVKDNSPTLPSLR